MPKTQSALELYRCGDKVLYSGEYCVVDQQGNKQDFDVVTLDEGETFPQLQDQNLCFMLSDTCLDESCQVVGDQTPDIE